MISIYKYNYKEYLSEKLQKDFEAIHDKMLEGDESWSIVYDKDKKCLLVRIYDNKPYVNLREKVIEEIENRATSEGSYTINFEYDIFNIEAKVSVSVESEDEGEYTPAYTKTEVDIEEIIFN